VLDSPSYLAKKSFFAKMMTIYGRNAVLEVLSDEDIEVYKLHLSQSNRPASVLQQMVTLAQKRGIEVVYHEKKALSRISKNAKQDQGVALDIVLPHAMDEAYFLQQHDAFRVMALDGVVNPQNVGMIIRSCAAGNIDAIILPTNHAAPLSALVIKASAGTLFRLPIIRSHNLLQTLQQFQAHQSRLYTLSAQATRSYREESYPKRTVFILGNETHGVSQAVASLADRAISIPMRRGVESLNVAVTASLLAFV